MMKTPRPMAGEFYLSIFMLLHLFFFYNFIKLIFALLIFKSLPTFKMQVKKFEKYIIPIKPFIPNSGKRLIIIIILIIESETAVRNVKTCWSRPFKIPSDILSIYIRGTIGDKLFIRKPTSFSL